MAGLLQIALSNAVAAAVLALPVAAVSRALRHAPLTRALWLIVLLKLVTPPVWFVPVWHAPAVSNAPVHLPQPGLPMAALPDTLPRDTDEDAVAAERGPEPSLSDPVITTQPQPRTGLMAGLMTHWVALLGAVWLIGIGAHAIAVIVCAFRMRRLLRLADSSPTAAEHRAAELAAGLGLRACPRVSFFDGPVSPMLCALGTSPRLLLPRRLWEILDDQQRDSVLAHELIHLRRGDHWLRAFELTVSAIYWWHPVVWWAVREIREATEQSCDAWVVRTLPRSARSYASALVEAIDFVSAARPAVSALASGMGQFTNLKRRLVMIKQGNLRPSLTWPWFTVVCGAAGLLLPLAPGLGAPPADASSDAVEQKAAEPEARPDVDKPATGNAAELERARAVVKEKQAQLEKAEKALARLDRQSAERNWNSLNAKNDGLDPFQDKKAAKEWAEKGYETAMKQAKELYEKAMAEKEENEKTAKVWAARAYEKAMTDAKEFNGKPMAQQGEQYQKAFDDYRRQVIENFGASPDQPQKGSENIKSWTSNQRGAAVAERLERLEKQLEKMTQELSNLKKELGSSQPNPQKF